MNRLEKILSHHINGGPGTWKNLYDDLDELISNVTKETLKNAHNSCLKGSNDGPEAALRSILKQSNIPKL